MVKVTGTVSKPSDEASKHDVPSLRPPSLTVQTLKVLSEFSGGRGSLFPQHSAAQTYHEFGKKPQPKRRPIEKPFSQEPQ